ncbi:uroporphyrinogen-III methyltransferase [Vibrio sp. JCM 19236]|nr:uroporphyrinogen-III methyltransferase [Vibrio sp. JCM 19236]
MKIRFSKKSPGRVTLVGAGPGDPDLLTVKALRAIEQAECIVFDNLVSQEIRALFPEKARCLFVGKSKGAHSSTQEEINQLLLDLALSGTNVCRVKGGDSFVFGRGGEEMLLMAQKNISVDVIPGITAASGCTSYANLPLTHRGVLRLYLHYRPQRQNSLNQLEGTGRTQPDAGDLYGFNQDRTYH